MQQSKLSATERVYARVKAEIIDGTLPGMTLLTETDTASDLGVSRTPVREAFLRLQAEGWLKLYPKRGAIVVAVRENEWKEVLEARALIETHAVQSLADDETRRTELAERLDELVDLQRAALSRGDRAGFEQEDTAFSRTIVTAAENLILAEFFVSLQERHERMIARSLWSRPEVPEAVIADHTELADAIRQGDVDRFRSACHRHLNEVHRELLSGTSSFGSAGVRA